jgi:tetratricopeptide (TPR) repeat protein
MPRVRLTKPSEKDLVTLLRDGMPKTFARLADVYRQDGRLDEAVSVCREGLEEFPDYGSGHMVLALTYQERGETEKALIEFHSALKCEPDNLLALKLIADIHWDASEFSLARSYYRQALQKDRFLSEAIERVRKNPKPESPKSIPDEKPTEPDSRSNMPEVDSSTFDTLTLARLYATQGHIKLAKQVCTGILEKDPENAGVRAFLAGLDEKTGRD